ncbi:MAG: hypothetical protein ACYCQI_16030 [Gammaproteobacteria bacterium]
MNQTNIIDFNAYQDEQKAHEDSHSDELINAIKDLIQRLRDSNPIKKAIG